MTQADRKRLGRYARRIADLLGLRDWTISIYHDEPDHKEAWASTECIYGRRIANLRFGHNFELVDAKEQRTVIIHELLHIHMDPVVSLVNQSLPGPLGLSAYGVFEAAFRERMEHTVDAIADAIAGGYPLPE